MSEGLKKLDPLLRLMVQELEDDRSARSLIARHRLPNTDQTIPIMVKYEGALEPLEELGLEVTRPGRQFASGNVELSRLARLAAHPNVRYVEYPRPNLLKLDHSIVEIRANGLRSVNTADGVWSGATGSGAIVGVIDTGIDIQHGAFRNHDGTTRILSVWDQGIDAQGDEVVPSLSSGRTLFGVEYDMAWINQAFASQEPDHTGPERIVRHRDKDGHGTHVAGIAAGSGAEAERCGAAFEYAGVAPEADLIVVKLRSFGDNKAQSRGDDIIEAAEFIFDRASTIGGPVGRPAVVNVSLGSHWGPHDGRGALESELNALVAADPQGRAIVVSAGNEAELNLHAQATVPANGQLDVKFEIQSKDRETRWLDLWYDAGSSLQASVIAPNGTATDFTTDNADDTKTITLGDDTEITVESDFNSALNGDNEITVFLKPKQDEKLPAGEWTLRLRNNGGSGVEFHAWLDEDKEHQPVFTVAAQISTATTLTRYACATMLIAVANYNDSGNRAGKLSPSSSHGPTRDGRPKPDVAAPGSNITAPRGNEPDLGEKIFCACCRDRYKELWGTSMAAPHVAGAIALMLQRNPQLRSSEILNHLRNTARKDADTNEVTAAPNNLWGGGKLDVQALLAAVPAVPVPPPSPSIQPAPTPMPTPSLALLAGPPASGPAPGANGNALFSNVQRLRERLAASAEGRIYLALFDRHFKEIYELINTNRRVATVWHRNDGPGLFSHAFRAAAYPDVPLPRKIEGRPVRDRLEKIFKIVARYASDALAADIAAYKDRLWSFEGLSINDILNQLDSTVY